MEEQQATAAQDFRRMAAQCREMAARSPRPGPLLVRAEAFEAIAAEIEQRHGRTKADEEEEAAVGEERVPAR